MGASTGNDLHMYLAQCYIRLASSSDECSRPKVLQLALAHAELAAREESEPVDAAAVMVLIHAHLCVGQLDHAQDLVARLKHAPGVDISVLQALRDISKRGKSCHLAFNLSGCLLFQQLEKQKQHARTDVLCLTDVLESLAAVLDDGLDAMVSSTEMPSSVSTFLDRCGDPCKHPRAALSLEDSDHISTTLLGHIAVLASILPSAKVRPRLDSARDAVAVFHSPEQSEL